MIEDALREVLARRRRRTRSRVVLTVVDGNGVSARVDLDDSAALLDVMERHRGPA